MANIPVNFTGTKFMTKYNKTIDDFWVDVRELICPSLPNLQDSDLLDCVITAPPPPSLEDRLTGIEDLLLAQMLGG